MRDPIVEYIAEIEIANEICSNPCDICKTSKDRCIPHRIARKLAKEGFQRQTEWISCDERLPTWEDGKVLIYTSYGISIAKRTTSNRWKGDCAIPKLITHWMPLPVPPEVRGE